MQQFHSRRTKHLDYEERNKIQPKQVRTRPLISERAKTVSARKREEEQQSFSAPGGLPVQGGMEGIACQLVHIKCSF